MKPVKLVQLIILMCGSYSFAQFGVGTTSPNASAQLEVVSNNKGILIPQLALTSIVDTSTITNGNVESLLVYNTSNTSGLTPGYYYWSNSKWNRLATSENSASVTVDNNLTSTSTVNALSAYQGLVLKGLVDVNTSKVGITTAEANAIVANTAKTGITVGQVADIAANKTGVASNGIAILTKVDKITGKELSANDFTDALKAKLDDTEVTTNKNIANGYVGLDANTKIDVSYLPSITINNVYTATSLAAQNALTPNTGDVVIRTDESKNYIYDGTAWLELASPSVDVTSVNGKTGVVTIGVGDIATLQTSLNSKVDEVTGKELSANDFTDILKTKLDGLANTTVANNLTTNSATDGLSANQGVVLKALVDVNTAKTGITTGQASAIVVNTTKVGITTIQTADIVANKTGVAANVTSLGNKAEKTNVLELDNTTAFTPDADYEPATKKYVDDNSTNVAVIDDLTSTSTAEALSANQGKVLKDLVDINTVKTGITTVQASAIVANTAKVVITTTQAADIAANKLALPDKAEKSNVLELDNTTAFIPDADYEPATKKYVDDNSTNATVTDNLTSTSTTDALSANQGKVLKDLVDVNTAKVVITTAQVADIAANKLALPDKADKSNVLELDNTTTFTPNADYEPATKKYVDDNKITVVNDLTTGGTDDALSAEQGKALEDAKLDKTLADGTIFIGNASGNAVSQTISSDATITNTGVLTIENDAVDGTDIELASEAAGSVMYNDGTNWVNLAKGTAGQALVMNTGATAPEWTTNSSTSTTLAKLFVPMGSDFTTTTANNAYQTVAFGAATKDTETGWDNANDKYEVAKAGDYWIDFNASWNNNGGASNDPMRIEVRVNGVTKLSVRHDVSDQISSGGYLIQNISGLLNDLSVSDEITIELYDSDNIIIIEGAHSHLSLIQLPDTAGVGVGGGGSGASDYDSLTDTDVTGVAAGAINYFDGTNWIDLPAGTAGQKLVVNSSGSAPEWVTETKHYIVVANDAARDALTTQLLDGLTVGVTASESNENAYAEFRVITANTAWATSTTQKVYPGPIPLADLWAGYTNYFPTAFYHNGAHDELPWEAAAAYFNNGDWTYAAGNNYITYTGPTKNVDITWVPRLKSTNTTSNLFNPTVRLYVGGNLVGTQSATNLSGNGDEHILPSIQSLNMQLSTGDQIKIEATIWGGWTVSVGWSQFEVVEAN